MVIPIPNPRAVSQEPSWAGVAPALAAGGDIGQTVARFLLPFGVELYGIASEAREQGGRSAGAPRKDWRNTLDRQERRGEK